MEKKAGAADGALAFVLSASAYQVITYFVAGMAASLILDYRALFLEPVMRDYYRPFGSVAIVIGPFLQVARGLLFGLVLLPFRKVLAASRHGWFSLWLLFVGLGILGPPAAAPSSLEGWVYTRIPLSFHLIGLPEVALQTLAFSLLLHRKLRAAEHPLPAAARQALRAFSVACVAFLGYTVTSIVFALALGADIGAGGADLRVLGQFLAPLLIAFALVLPSSEAGRAGRHLLMYALSALALGLYQALVLGSANLVYVLVAPVLPVAISFFLTGAGRATGKPEAGALP